ncbi:AAA domain-containing protein, partial [Mycena epipterygia]
KNFCIITPYDAQRATIERQLKAENLPYDAVFNVDSFQGNEADYVLVSVVRTTQPGFLRSLNRMNVMLTRARAGMVLVTNAAFLHGAGGPTLLGQLARYW